MRLVIGDKNLSSWSLRPWLVMRHAAVAFDEELVPFARADWRDAIRELSPSRRVPALHDDGLVVWDSLAICEHVAERFPEKHLWPDDRAARAVARSIACEMHAGFSAMRRELPMDVALRAPRDVLSAEAAADVERVQEIWSTCRRRFGAAGPFLFGAFSIADAMFAPVVFRFRTYAIALADDDVRAYCDTMLGLSAMREWERDALAEVAAATGAATATTAAAASPRRTPSPTSAEEVHAVVFSSRLRGGADRAAYEEAAQRMVVLAAEQPGFLGVESARGADGFGITVSYWSSREAIARWKAHAEHRIARARGREAFYERYDVRVCTVDRAYRFP